jgi:hypothetical protein
MVDAGVPYDAGTVPPDYNGYWLNFDGAQLTVHSPGGQVVANLWAVSGRPGTRASDQDKENRGPIPEGTYMFEPSEFAPPVPMFGDWGNLEVKVTPTAGTQTFGREGFHIHGGIERGSAGCIDVGPSDQALYDALRDVAGSVYLTVRYDNPNAFNWTPGDTAWQPPGGMPRWADEWGPPESMRRAPGDQSDDEQQPADAGEADANASHADDDDQQYPISTPDDQQYPISTPDDSDASSAPLASEPEAPVDYGDYAEQEDGGAS